MKLIKTVTDNYILVDATKEFHGEGYLLGTTTVSDAPRLSLKNCQAIELGYDLDELAEQFMIDESYGEPSADLWKGYLFGFQKALKILGDKKFSEEDMRNAFISGSNVFIEEGSDDVFGSEFQKEEDDFIQSLQQTEWCVSFNPDEKDSEGCLILKRL